LAAAPPPKELEAAKHKRTWGETIDADKDCFFIHDGEKLKVAVSGIHHVFRASLDNGGQGLSDNAPRTARKVKGDFTMTVKLLHTLPKPNVSNAGALSGAGVYVLGGDFASSVALHHIADVTGVARTAGYRLWNRKFNDSTSESCVATDDEVMKFVTIELIREGNKVAWRCNGVGNNWRPLRTFDGEFPTEVTVGVYAENTGAKGYEAVFEGLKVETGEKK
jgi:hypothetical protein